MLRIVSALFLMASVYSRHPTLEPTRTMEPTRKAPTMEPTHVNTHEPTHETTYKPTSKGMEVTNINEWVVNVQTPHPYESNQEYYSPTIVLPGVGKTVQYNLVFSPSSSTEVGYANFIVRVGGSDGTIIYQSYQSDYYPMQFYSSAGIVLELDTMYASPDWGFSCNISVPVVTDPPWLPESPLQLGSTTPMSRRNQYRMAQFPFLATNVYESSKFDGACCDGSATIIDKAGVLYYGTSNNVLWAIFSTSLKEKWHLQLPNKSPPGQGIVGAPVIDDNNLIFVGSADTFLYAVQADSTLVWQRQIGAMNYSPAIGSFGSLFVVSNNCLYALSRVDGTLVWEKCSLDPNDHFYEPVFKSNEAYVATSAGLLYAFDQSTASYKNISFDEPLAWSPAIGADGTLYLGSVMGAMFAVDPNFYVKWKVPIENNDVDDIYSGAPIVIDSNQLIYFWSNGPNGVHMHVWSISFTEVYAIFVGDPPNGSPILDSGGSVYFSIGGVLKAVYADGDGGVKLIDLATHEASVLSSPTIGPNGRLYYTDNYGSLYGLGPGSTQCSDSGTSPSFTATTMNACLPAPPTSTPTAIPTVRPSISSRPTSDPTSDPTAEIVFEPTSHPVAKPTSYPVAKPTREPIAEPIRVPIAEPTSYPTADSTADSTPEPTAEPSTSWYMPTNSPTRNDEPTSHPSVVVPLSPTEIPTTQSNRVKVSFNVTQVIDHVLYESYMYELETSNMVLKQTVMDVAGLTELSEVQILNIRAYNSTDQLHSNIIKSRSFNALNALNDNTTDHSIEVIYETTVVVGEGNDYEDADDAYIQTLNNIESSINNGEFTDDMESHAAEDGNTALLYATSSTYASISDPVITGDVVDNANDDDNEFISIIIDNLLLISLVAAGGILIIFYCVWRYRAKVIKREHENSVKNNTWVNRESTHIEDGDIFIPSDLNENLLDKAS